MMTESSKPRTRDQFAEWLHSCLETTTLQDQPDISHEDALDALAGDVERLDEYARQWELFLDYVDRGSQGSKSFRQRFERDVSQPQKDEYDQAVEATCRFMESEEVVSLNQPTLLRKATALLGKAALALANRIFLRLHKAVDEGWAGTFQCPNGKAARCVFYATDTDDVVSDVSESEAGEAAPEQTRKSLEFFVKSDAPFVGGYFDRRRSPTLRQIRQLAPEGAEVYIHSYRGTLIRPNNRQAQAKVLCVTLFDQYVIAWSVDRPKESPRRRSPVSHSRTGRRRALRLDSRMQRRMPSYSVLALLVSVVVLAITGVQIDSKRRQEIAELQSAVIEKNSVSIEQIHLLEERIVRLENQLDDAPQQTALREWMKQREVERKLDRKVFALKADLEQIGTDAAEQVIERLIGQKLTDEDAEIWHKFFAVVHAAVQNDNVRTALQNTDQVTVRAGVNENLANVDRNIRVLERRINRRINRVEARLDTFATTSQLEELRSKFEESTSKQSVADNSVGSKDKSSGEPRKGPLDKLEQAAFRRLIERSQASRSGWPNYKWGAIPVGTNNYAMVRVFLNP